VSWNVDCQLSVQPRYSAIVVVKVHPSMQRVIRQTVEERKAAHKTDVGLDSLHNHIVIANAAANCLGCLQEEDTRIPVEAEVDHCSIVAK